MIFDCPTPDVIERSMDHLRQSYIQHALKNVERWLRETQRRTGLLTSEIGIHCRLDFSPTSILTLYYRDVPVMEFPLRVGPGAVVPYNSGHK